MSGQVTSKRALRGAVRSSASASLARAGARSLHLRVSPEVYDALAAYGRTLKSARGREASYVAEAILARLVGLLREFQAALGPAETGLADQSPAGNAPEKLPSFREAMNQYRRDLILARLRTCGNGRALRASLGMPKTTLLRWTKLLGISFQTSPEPVMPGLAESEGAHGSRTSRS